MKSFNVLDALLECLDEREQKILTLRFYGNLTQSQIADQIGVSQMHVSRLLTRALTKLRGVHTLIVGHSHAPRVRALPNGKLLTAPTNEPMYFTDKKVAKTYRDKNGGIVVVGPDHRRHPERLRQQRGELGGGDFESLLAALGASGQPVSWQKIEFGAGQTRLIGIRLDAAAEQSLQGALQARGWRVEPNGNDWRLEWERK